MQVHSFRNRTLQLGSATGCSSCKEPPSRGPFKVCIFPQSNSEVMGSKATTCFTTDCTDIPAPAPGAPSSFTDLAVYAADHFPLLPHSFPSHSCCTACFTLSYIRHHRAAMDTALARSRSTFGVGWNWLCKPQV